MNLERVKVRSLGCIRIPPRTHVTPDAGPVPRQSVLCRTTLARGPRPRPTPSPPRRCRHTRHPATDVAALQMLRQRRAGPHPKKLAPRLTRNAGAKYNLISRWHDCVDAVANAASNSFLLPASAEPQSTNGAMPRVLPCALHLRNACLESRNAAVERRPLDKG